ncbi:hypothetical protein N8577_04615 [Akkermansiaceae bacterium]|nr:hypothetical protein [Akkermansiaceae bacterium]
MKVPDANKSKAILIGLARDNLWRGLVAVTVFCSGLYILGDTGDNTWVVIDLGAPAAGLSTMYLWNVQEGNALDRGVKDFEVFHATSPTLLPPVTGGTVTPYSFTSGGWTAIGDAELKMGTQIGDAGQAYDLSDAAGARYIGLKLTSNHGGGGRTGFAEVAFSDVVDPDAITPGEPAPPDPPVEPGDGKVVSIAEVFAFHQGDSFDANGSVLKIADGSGMAKIDAEDPSTWTISSTAWADDWQGFSADNSGDNTYIAKGIRNVSIAVTVIYSGLYIFGSLIPDDYVYRRRGNGNDGGGGGGCGGGG